ncbi:MAG: tRNA (N6-threonylcarbamoyladenosine(37)-N6)-methyltransferase TrmO [Victivallaceae bacterium]|nr:tRNA (N6-threonylcarbamoyladenosine(37)-N6)-methyltransferase TrmO [Victivallaceae bacterium]
MELAADPKLAEACRDLAGVERIWVIFVFHLNGNWKPFVRPPVSPHGRKISTFATRAPYRPNPVGLSCVELERIEKNLLFVRKCDLLDGTPVLDIKPYVPAADAFPDSRVPWLNEASAAEYKVAIMPSAMEKIIFLREIGAVDLENFVRVQLATDPVNASRKRVVPDGEGRFFIGCRTWQIVFFIENDQVVVADVLSHYPEKELADGSDVYGDKAFHRAFLEKFRGC